MVQDISKGNETLLEFERLIETGSCNPWEGQLRTGVDLGTANIVLAVVDEENRPVAGATYPSTVVRDGIVVDYIGALNAVTRLKDELEARLGTTLEAGACAIPPGIIEGNVRVIGNVVEGAGFRLTNVVDEPTAAAAVLGITDGAVVDVGGGTTGISILKDGKVIFTGDEPTGGTHMTLVLAGFHGWSIQEAEAAKRDPAQESRVYPVVKPVVEKMASIVGRYLKDYPVDEIYVVGGACCFTQFEQTFEKCLGTPVIKPAAPLLVTPLGIAVNCTL
ncbi:MAG: ethanolamine utilization protein EutJ [Clostridiales bacterium]|uniref:ethanolamine utilization protein EutJ n=1 Tax=Flavonifractor porci TaxID=3133422 RepID=UPI0030B00402|nr:ethanolamine utilization protein EutJ [Clostridiales bacterium]